jgi:hypothetical protein
MRPNRRDIDPEILTIRALRKIGFAAICELEPPDSANAGRRLSGILAAVVLIGIVLALRIGAGIPYLAGIVIVIAAVFCLVSLSASVKPLGRYGMLIPTAALGILVLGWAALGVWFSIKGHVTEIVTAYVFSIFAVLVFRWMGRALKLVAKVPIFVPAALVVVVAPLFTGDPWRFVSAARFRLSYVAIVTLAPLMILVISKFKNLSLDQTFARAADAIAKNPDEARTYGKKILRSTCLTRENWPRIAELESFFRRPYGRDQLSKQVADLSRAASPAFHRRAAFELTSLLIGVILVTYVFVYMLAVLAVPVKLAQDWSNVNPVIVAIHPIAQWEVNLPVWPYAGVAFLSSVVTAVGFLALALTEETYTTAVVDTVFGGLARRLIIVGAPYYFHGGRAKRIAADYATANGPAENDSKNTRMQDTGSVAVQRHPRTKQAKRRTGRKIPR